MVQRSSGSPDSKIRRPGSLCNLFGEVWVDNVDGEWFEAVEIYTRDAQGNLHLEVTMYDPEAFVAPLRLEIIYTFRAAPVSDERYQWKECQQTLFNINGRLQPVRPGTVIEYRVPDWYDRPWARVWEQYFEQGVTRPDEREDIISFE